MTGVGGGGIKYFYHGLPAYTGDNPRAKARGLPPHVGGQTEFLLGLLICRLLFVNTQPAHHIFMTKH